MANAVIGALRVNLSIDTAAWEEGIKGVQASMTRVGKNLQGAGKKLSLYVTAPIAAAGATVGLALKGMADEVAEFTKGAQLSNASFEEFQRLAFAAKSVGFETEKLSDIYKDVNDRVGDFMATGGGPMADFFENIAPKVGITADAFRDLSGPNALQLYYDSLVKAGASQQDMTFYLEAMASDTTALIPLLQNGGKAMRELGEGANVLSEADAESFRAYTAAMRELDAAIGGLGMVLANSGIVDLITSIVTKVTEWTQWLSTINPEIVKWGVVVAGAAAAIGPLLIGVGLMVTAMAAISAPVLAAVAAVAAVGAGIVALYQGIQIAIPYIQQLGGPIWEGITTGAANALATVKQFAVDLVATFQAIPAQMAEVGRNIMAGLKNGIVEGFGTVKESVHSMAASIRTIFGDPLGINSPSTVMHEMGGFIMQGLNNGLDSMAGTTEGIVSSISSSVMGAFKGLIDGSKTVKEALSEVLASLGDMLMNSAFQSIFGGGGLGGGGGGGLFGGLLGGIGSLLGFANGGKFQVGGAGGIDSQLVAFRASPNETVSITKPGQDAGGGGGAFQVQVAPSQYFDVHVQKIADNVASHRVQQGQAQAARQMPNLQSDRQRRTG